MVQHDYIAKVLARKVGFYCSCKENPNSFRCSKNLSCAHHGEADVRHIESNLSACLKPKEA